jgi:hypothetical protein
MHFNLDVVHDAFQPSMTPTIIKIPFRNANSFPVTVTVQLMCASVQLASNTSCGSVGTSQSPLCADPWPKSSRLEPVWVPCGCEKFVSVTFAFSGSSPSAVRCGSSNLTAHLDANEVSYATVSLLFASEMLSYGVKAEAQAGGEDNRAVVQVGQSSLPASG